MSNCLKSHAAAHLFVGNVEADCVVAVCVLCIFLVVSRVGMSSVIVAFPDNTHLLS